MDQTRIDTEMHALEEIIEYKFNNLSLLADAMKSVKLDKRDSDGDNHKEYSNEALSCLGDTVIKFLIAQHLYNLSKRKGEMTVEKSALENNKVFHEIADEKGIIAHAYNDDYFAKDDPPQHKKVRSKKHDPYIEAIAAAIFLDGGWKKVGEWFEKWLLPNLEQHKSSKSIPT